MKIRTGFVSNSSSASFIVKFHLDKETFLSCLSEEFWNATKEDQLQRLQQTLDKLKSDEKNGELFSSHFKNEIERTEASIKTLSTLTTNNEIVYHYLSDLHGIDIREGFNNWTEVEAWTSMLNDYSEMPDVLKQIILYFTFEHPEIELICRVHRE